MKFSFCDQIGFMRFFRGIEPSQKVMHAVDANPGSVFTVPFRYTKKSCLISRMSNLLILNVFGSANIPKVIDTIVGWISIDVINIIHRKISVNVQPCQSVCSPSNTVNRNYNVTAPIDCSGYTSYFYSAVRFFDPCKNPRVGIIIEPFLKCFCVNRSHGMSLT